MATRRKVRHCPRCGKVMSRLVLLNAHYCKSCKRMFYPRDTKGIPAPYGDRG